MDPVARAGSCGIFLRSAKVLEIALQMAAVGVQPTNRVRFTFWGAEESGLLGSQFHVDSLSQRERKDTALYLI